MFVIIWFLMRGGGAYYSHSTNSSIWKFICYVFAEKTFANMLIFHLLFLVAHFLSIKIVSQKTRDCNAFMPSIVLSEFVSIWEKFRASPSKIGKGGQTPLGIAHLDYRRAEQNRAKIPLTAMWALFILTVDWLGWLCYLPGKWEVAATRLSVFFLSVWLWCFLTSTKRAAVITALLLSGRGSWVQWALRYVHSFRRQRMRQHPP